MAENQSAVERFIDEIEDRIRKNPELTIAETVGALQMVAHNLMICAYGDGSNG